MYRIGREARRQGLETIPCPAPRAGPRTLRFLVFDVRQYLRELMAVPAYGTTWHFHRFRHGPLGVKVMWMGRQVTGRVKSLLGEADAVTAASETISRRIKKGVAGFSDTDMVTTPASGLGRPVEGDLGHPFGLRHGRLHSGIDFRAAYGSPVTASAAGQVLFSGMLGPYGNVVVIHHGGGLATVYGHLAGFVVSEGDQVTDGKLIGYLGETGRSYGPNLHFEVRVHGSPVEPMVYLSKVRGFTG
jgi:murein DD-endopeptidase MepM/ murein hydrolase activator NlpD